MNKDPTLKQYLETKHKLLYDIYMYNKDITPERKECVLNELIIIDSVIEICKNRGRY